MRSVWRSKITRGSLALALGASLAIPVALPAQANDTGNTLLADFEIDGNFYEGFDNGTTATGPDGVPVDWGSDDIFPDLVDVVEDPLGGVDPTVYDSGAKEDDLESWEDAGSAAAPGKSDVGDMYIHDRFAEGEQWLFFGFERPSDSGSTAWYIELNQLPNTTNAIGTTVPNRSVDDVRIYLVNQGNGEFVVERIDRWVGASWVNVGIVPITLAVNDSPITTPTGELGLEQFGEFGFSLADVLTNPGDCTFTGFATLNLRSLASPSEQSELKDYATSDINIPGRCGDIRIEKRDAEGALIGPVTFEISPDPTPGSAAESLEVTDNEAPDTDDTVGVIVISPAEPGDYTITEVTPPPGYIQTTAPQDAVLEEFGEVTVVFTNRLGTVTWEKRDAADGELICCATFTISPNPLIGEPADPALTVTDNDGVYDTNPADGVITVEDLKTGTYTVTETVAPTGYDLPADPDRTFDISVNTPDVTIEPDFEDPRTLSELGVLKLDADTQDPLAGATFALYRDNGDGLQVIANDELVEECTTEADGTCEIDELEWGTYYWFEVSAPDGYDLPADPFSGMITITAQNAGDDFTASVFRDSQVRSNIKILKLDAVTGDELAGAEFVVRLDDGDGVFEFDDDIVDPPGVVTTDATGTVVVGGLTFGDYWVEEITPPTGYELPDPPHQGPFTFSTDNAGTTTAVTFDDPQILTDLTVRKLDGGAESDVPLEGAVFELYQDDGDGVTEAPPAGEDTLAGTCTTGADGTCTVDDLSFGDYYWYEVSAPAGYNLPDDQYGEIIHVNAGNAGEEVTIDFFNPRKPGNLTVRKFDFSDGSVLAGATFDLVLDDGDGVFEEGDDDVVGSCTTGAEGTCSIGDLDFGTYFWVEIEAPEGYDLPATTVSGPVTIDQDNVEAEVQISDFRDPRKVSELTVMKVDEADGAALAGAEFDLVLDTNDNGTYDEGVDVAEDSCTTGADGTCTITGLDFGTYWWVETAAPTGYELPDDVVSDPIIIDASNAGDEITTTVFDDPRTPSELTVEKLDAADEAPLAGAVFDLVLDDGDSVYESDIDAVVDSCTTGDDGICTIGDLDFGTYFWVETTAPVGYGLPDNPVSDPIDVDASNAGTAFDVVTFLDPRLPTELAVLKVEEGTDTPLAGGVFELYLDDGDGVGDEPDEGDEIVGECTTGEDGFCSIGDLDFGDYYWFETKAPEGYLIPDDATSDVVTVSAENAGSTLVFTFEDPKVPPTPPEPEMPDTGASPWLLLLSGAGALALGAGLIIGKRGRWLRRTET